jgi:hypothetical protein
VFKGRQALEEWHQERFDAEFEFVSVNKITADGDKVTLDAVITSKKLRVWRIRKLAGKAVFRLHEGKIREVKFSPRMYNPFEGW